MVKVFLLTTFALTAFAFNSILCRLALGTGSIDAASFTLVRIVSGAAALLLILRLSSAKKREDEDRDAALRHPWVPAFFLFAYAICFSFAYLELTTATGALILFGTVQATMIVAAIRAGERPGPAEWTGLALALGGLVYLVLPGLESPPLRGSLLMALAGVAWGFYTLRGRGSASPLADTTHNFLRAAPLTLAACLPFLFRAEINAAGAFYAVVSGAVASGIGYAVWYAALRHHTATSAAVVQLSVPVIAAAGGLALMAETLSLRLVLAGALVLGGIALAVLGRRPKKLS